MTDRNGVKPLSPELRDTLTRVAEERVAEAQDRVELRCSIGASAEHVLLNVGQYELRLTPEQAEAMAVDLRRFSIEVRSGGKLA